MPKFHSTPKCARTVRFALAAAVVTGASAAWACVPQPLITLSPTSSGPVGTALTVNGYAVNGRAEIRWNAIDGPLLASAEGPAFSVPVTIPSTPAGLYSLLLLERGADGGLGSTGRAAFQVTSVGVPTSQPQGSTSAPTTTVAARSSSTSVSPEAALLGGIALFALGGAGGTIVTRRRPRRGRNMGEITHRG